MTGYPKEIEIQINIKNCESSFLILGLEEEKEEEKKEEEKIIKEEINEEKDYQKNLLKLISTLNKIRKSQITAYKNYPIIRFIYGRQFNLIYNILKENEIKKAKLSPFLKLITNNLMEKDLDNFSYKLNAKTYDDIIENIQKFLEEILKKKDGDNI